MALDTLRAAVWTPSDVPPVSYTHLDVYKRQAQEYDTVKQNVDALLTVPKEQEQQRRHELE